MALELDIPCPDLPKIPEIPSISVLGGAELKAFLNFADGVPTDCKLTFNLLLQLGPLLAVSACLLKILEVMGKLLEFFQAAPDPFKMGDKALQVIPALEALIPCIPPLAPFNLFIMIKGILELIIRFLLCFLSSLKEIISFQLTLDFSGAEGNPALQASLECAKNNAQVSMDNLLKSLEPLQPILSAVTSIGGTVGLDLALPDFSGLSLETGAESVIASLEDAVSKLQQVIETIPG